MVTGDLERAGKVTHLVTGVILQEFTRDGGLTIGLLPRLGRKALDQLCKEVLHLRLPHLLRGIRTSLSNHVVPLGILERIVQARPRAVLHSLHERPDFAF